MNKLALVAFTSLRLAPLARLHAADYPPMPC